MASKPKLTKPAVDGLKIAEKPYVAWCGELSGFGVSVRPSGHKAFIAQYDFGGRSGKTRRVTIGTYGNPWTVAEARKEAEAILLDAKRGIDRGAAKAKRKAEPTVAELCDEYLAHGCKLKKASTVNTDKGRIERHIKPLIGSMKITDVTRATLQRFFNDVAEGKKISVPGGEGTARRTMRLLGGIFTYAVDQGYLEASPRKGVKIGADRKGERFLSPTELARLGDTLREAETVGLPWQFNEGVKAKHRAKPENAREVISPHAIAAIRLLILTGCRAGEILNLRWSEVDMEHGILNLPDSKTREKKVLLGAAALKVLSEVPKVEGNPYVIVGEAKDKPRSDLKRPWARITAHAGLNAVDRDGKAQPLRLHDLRHSFASVGAASGFGLAAVGKLLGHSSTSTTARYAHFADDPLRGVMNTIDSTIAAKLGMIEAADNVVAIKTGAA